MDNPRRGYVAYLLRMYQVGECESAPWRASLESPQTGQRWGFADLAELFTFLEKEARQVAQGQTTPRTGEKGGEIST